MRRLALTALLVGMAACTTTRAPCESREWPPIRIAVANPRVQQTAVHDAFGVESFTVTPLVRIDGHGRPHPGLAESWETSDRQSWTFTLRANLHSHSGLALTAERLRQWVLADLATPQYNNRFWHDLQSVQAPAPNRLVFRFVRPVSMLPEALRLLWINHNDPNRTAGPWRITRETQDEMDLEAFPPVTPGSRRPTRMHIATYPSARAAWAAFLRNETDVLYEVPPAAIPVLTPNPDIRVYAASLSRVSTFVFNLRSRGLRDVRVRQAINLAIDRQEVERRVYSGFAQVARRTKPLVGPFSPDYWATEGIASPWHTDLPAARALLKDATRGHPEPIEIVCLTSSEYPEVAELGANMEAQLQRVHIRLRLEPLSFKPLTERIARGDFDAVIVPLVTGSGALFPYLAWHSGTRAAGFSRDTDYAGADAAFDRLYAASTPDTERAALREVIDALYRDPPAAFLVPILYIRAVRNTWRPPEDEPDIRRTVDRWVFEAPCAAS